MTPKEKAEEITLLYYYNLGKHLYVPITFAKQCALIAVDEIMKAPHENQYIELIPSDADNTDWFWDKFDEYWEEVKQEIEKL